jgi:uncharacterized membrane protein
MGGFLDGIAFHQIFQTHNMLSAIRAPDNVANLEANMVWDGFFHAATWFITAVGIALLWNAGRRDGAESRSGKSFIGSLLMGWGLFNMVEGLIDHHILGIHHVVERLGLSMYDYVFFGSGLLFLVSGWMLIRVEAPEQPLTDPLSAGTRDGRS